MVLGALQGWPSGLGCWDGWRHGWSAWAVVSSGAGGGRRSYAVIFCALPLSSPLSPSPPLSLSRSSAPWVQAVGLALVFGWGWLCMGAGVPGSLGWVGLALPAILASSPPLLGAGFAFRPLAAGSPLAPAGLCWALTAWGLLGAGSGSAWASLAPGSALVQGWRVSRPCRWWLAWLSDGLAVGVVAGVSHSSNCTNQALQVWLLFKGKAINFERFFLDFAHKVRYNSTRVKEIVNQLRFAASPLVDGGRNPQKGLVKQS